MTIAHEIGHAVLHQALYEKDDRQLDLLMPPELVPVYCARTEVVRSVDWCEWQANFFAGTLLMPSEILRARLFAKDPAFLEPRSLNSRDGGAVVALVAREFDVSKDAARVRLSQIGLLKPEALQKLEHLG